MAREILEIYNEIIEEKELKANLQGLLPDPETSDNLLDDLASDSKVAVWRLWAYVTAVAIHIHELLWDAFKTSVDALILSAPTGTPSWYQRQVLQFQYGDDLEWVDQVYVYNPVDETKQIITRAAIDERSDGVVIIKVAKGNPVLTKLTPDEKSALESYIAKIKFAGTRVAVFSLNADELNIAFEIFYDPIIPLADVQQNVRDQIQSYLGNLPFNARFSVTSFTDYLQAAEGVLDPVFTSAEITPEGGSPISFERTTLPASGYIILSDDISNLFTWTPALQ